MECKKCKEIRNYLRNLGRSNLVNKNKILEILNKEEENGK